MSEKVFIANVLMEILVPALELDFIFWKQMDWTKVALKTKFKKLCQRNLNNWN